MIEVELKSRVPDLERTRARLESGGARLVFAGELRDRRYDRPDRELLSHDHVLRVRTYVGAGVNQVQLNWKGPTHYEGGLKRREEIGVDASDAGALTTILERLGYTVIMAIDRQIWQYEIVGTVVRLERYPRMDDLIEVEGSPDAIEAAIERIGLPRADFCNERLAAFVTRFEQRTGTRAALSLDALAGVAHDDSRNA